MILVSVMAEVMAEYTALLATAAEQLFLSAPLPRRVQVLILRRLPRPSYIPSYQSLSDLCVHHSPQAAQYITVQNYKLLFFFLYGLLASLYSYTSSVGLVVEEIPVNSLPSLACFHCYCFFFCQTLLLFLYIFDLSLISEQEPGGR